MFNPKKNIEPSNSRIEWVEADSTIKEKLVVALLKKNKIARICVNIVFFFLAVCLLSIIAYCMFLACKFPEAVVLYGIFVLSAGIILSVVAHSYIKGIPYAYPEKQSKIWIYRTKCFRIGESGTHPDREHGYFAFFNSKAGQICMLISYKEYKSNPVGKEYIFYKFNNRTGNLWEAITADKLDEA